ncbi:MAG: tetraacyldisaccharide 4'-kinase [Candidatus Obscuribacter sp.]|nr:tetraacyldisaccharide 4'-kinase [Candidatus Obscuribacter sp.]
MKLLTPLSLVYGAGAYLRILGYQTGLNKRLKSDARVISIGNLTVGGTGKTPVVIDTARRLVSQGKRWLSYRAAMVAKARMISSLSQKAQVQ